MDKSLHFVFQLIEKLSVRTPSGEVKLKVMKEIAKEYQVDWDTTESEMELLKPSEERIVCFIFSFSLPLCACLASYLHLLSLLTRKDQVLLGVLPAYLSNQS